MLRNLVPILLMIGGALVGVAQAAQLLVIDAENAAYPPGTLLKSDEAVQLGAGAHITLLAPDGNTIRIKGPFKGVAGRHAAGGNERAMMILSSLLGGKGDSTAALGAIRFPEAASRAARLPAPELIGVAESGDRCVYRNDAVLWREDAGHESRLTIDDRDHHPRTLPWPAGAQRLALPAADFQDGRRYLLSLDGKQIDIWVHKPGRRNLNPAELAAWMAENSCLSQVFALVEGMK